MAIVQPKWTNLPAKNLSARDPRMMPVAVVLHDTANVGTHNETLYLASQNKEGVSVDFTVERDGSVWKLNPDLRKFFTHHAGFKTHFRGLFNKDVNRRTIGIEICQMEKVIDYPLVQVDAVARLCAWLVQEFKLSKDDITTHARIDTANRRSDPRLFPWDDFWARYKVAASGMPQPATPPAIKPSSGVIRHDGPQPLITLDNCERSIVERGKCSSFGGPGDSPSSGNKRDDWKVEGLAFLTEKDLKTPHLANLFGPVVNGLTGMARRLRNKDRFYVAMRWDKSVTPYAFLKTIAVRVTNPKTGISVDALPADWGPALTTGRLVDCSDYLLQVVGTKTDADLIVSVPLP